MFYGEHFCFLKQKRILISITCMNTYLMSYPYEERSNNEQHKFSYLCTRNGHYVERS